MNKTWAVFKYEFLTTISRRSFILTLILVPLIPGLIIGLLSLLNESQTQELEQAFTQEATIPLPLGVIDQSGLISAFPDWITGGNLIAIADEPTARQKVLDGQLDGFYLIPQDYLQSGKITLVKPEVNALTGFTQSDVLDRLIEYNLLGADQSLYLKYTNPTAFQLEQINPETADSRDTGNMLSFYLPYGVMIFFYIIIFSTSSMMLNSIGKEKDSHVMEVLLSSLKPTEMFTGKIIGLGLAGLLQMVVWFGAAILMLRLGGTTLSIPPGLQIPASVFFLAILFFLLGYGVYGSLMAGIGAMVPNLRESSQSTFVLTLPLIFTLLSISSMIQQPHGSLATILSLFPMTAPVAMMTRLTIGNVPGWQVLLSLVLLALTVWFLVRGVSNLFRSQTLLAGQRFSIGSFMKVLFQK
ncbi:MAG: ABC transporter permease [Anaerolineaceae bacterium]